MPENQETVGNSPVQFFEGQALASEPGTKRSKRSQSSTSSDQSRHRIIQALLTLLLVGLGAILIYTLSQLF